MLEHLKTLAPNSRVRLITLTLRSNNTALVDQLDRLIACYRKLRKWSGWHKTQDGGLGVIEVTLNRDKSQWHPHIHIVSEGRFLAQAALSKKWREITGDSFVVDVRAAGTDQQLANYLTKYLTKSISTDVTRDHNRLVEAIAAMTGRKTLITTGTWCALHLTKYVPDAEWVDILPLATAIAKARAGDASLRALLAMLHVTPETNPTNPKQMLIIPPDD